MTASVRIDRSGSIDGQATLRLVGLDSEEASKNPIRVVLNGTVIYEGPNPLPNDTCCNGEGQGNWGVASFRFSSGLLERDNDITITNLDPGSCTYCPNFVMVDYGELSYRVRE
jgi:hypothetical protein